VVDDEVDELDAHERRDDSPEAVDAEIAPQRVLAPTGRYRSPRKAIGTSSGMIRASKTIAEMIADRGEPRPITLRPSSGPVFAPAATQSEPAALACWKIG